MTYRDGFVLGVGFVCGAMVLRLPFALIAWGLDIWRDKLKDDMSANRIKLAAAKRRLRAYYLMMGREPEAN